MTTGRHALNLILNSIGAAQCDHDGQIIPVNIYPVSHFLRKTNSVIDSKYNSLQVGIYPFWWCTARSIPGQCGGILSTNKLLNYKKNA